MAKRRSPRRRNLGRLTLTLGLAAILAAGAIAADLVWWYPDRPGKGILEAVTVVIPKGIGPTGLASLLEDAGVLDSPRKFTLWLRLTSGMSGVRSGQAVLNRGMSPRQLLAALSQAGRSLGVRVTIPEGFTVRRIAALLESAGIANSAEVISLAASPSFLTEIGASLPTAEGQLFPDTYYFERGYGARSALTTLHRTLHRRLTEAGIEPTRVTKEVLTLASIVQAEAKVEDEMPTIAGVYRNRLTSAAFPSRLMQADPTVAYGCAPLVGEPPASCLEHLGGLTRRQLDDASNAFNTYAHPGLPPTPICSPGLAAIRAALAPAEVPYLYFVAEKATGRHAFSVTLAEHNAAVRRYRAPD